MPGAFESLQKLKQNASLQQVQDILSTDLDLLCAEPRLATTLLGQLGKAGKLDVALHVFRTLQCARAVPNEFHYGAFCYNSAISACARSAQWHLSISLLDELTSAELVPTDTNYNSAISACVKGGQWGQALSLLQEMMQIRLPCTASSYSAAMGACEGASQWQSALEFLETMVAKEQLQPDTISWTAAMSTCSKATQWEASLLLLAEMQNLRLSRDEYSFNAAMSACEKSSRWDMAFSVFETMMDSKASPGLITYNTAIGSCKRSGEWERALLLWQHIAASALVPDVITYNCIIGTCQVASQWEKALHVFNLMNNQEKDGSTFTELALAFERAKERNLCHRRLWRFSLELLSQVRHLHMVPDGTLFGSLAGAVGAARGKEVAMSMLREQLSWWREMDEGMDDDNLVVAAEVDVVERRPGVVVLNKPAGLSIETLLQQAFGSTWARKVQTVSRLDYPTSGVVPVAAGPDGSLACQWLQAQFSAKLVQKEYLCLAEGPFLGEVGEVGRITKPLRTTGVDSLRTEVSDMGRFASTGYKILKRFKASNHGELKLVLAMPETGRTHQIRVHFASIQQPLLGDETYGAKLALTTPSFYKRCPRLFLHCRRRGREE
ncbi:Pentatricopeptide repeat-containing protein MRL1 [Durusdinium trenchii]|uniref:Chloroplastic (Protein MATURATION OF RBCL 1) (AtMRL1) n=2 Tax=Durusdinium trenchii TaxID=1381693 RepID=A0ABP0LWJ0_9DINO